MEYQLEKIEERLDQLTQLIIEHINTETEDILIGFYEEEIAQPRGKLHHLTRDARVTKYFRDLDNEEGEDEYESRPFGV